MTRLSVELTAEQHKHLKAKAALEGRSIKEYVLSRIFSSSDDTHASLKALEDFLQPRIEEADSGRRSKYSVTDIFRHQISPRN